MGPDQAAALAAFTVHRLPRVRINWADDAIGDAVKFIEFTSVANAPGA
jgi:hypothetical protein